MNRSAILITSLGVAIAATGTAAAGQLAQMTTPTRNIGCIASRFDGKANLRCDIRTHSFVAPAQPASCPLDYGDSFSLGSTGAARWTCHGDTALPPPNGHGFTTVSYGRDWKWGPFTCQVRMTGVTCRNRSQKGFFLSKQAARRI
jgi:hypothetical protein